MKIAHIGPPLARTGGPAGYLLQLQEALACESSRHQVLFPDRATPGARPPAPSRPLLGRLMTRVKRSLAGAPAFYRPGAATLRERGGDVDDMIRRALDDMASGAAWSLARAEAARADVLFTHDLGTAVAALDRRSSGQAVWLMMHSPMSMALYLAWNWGVPEQTADEVLSYPDVRFWTRYEVDVCRRVDRLILPCREAADDLARCDPAFALLLANADVVMTGASRAPVPGSTSREVQPGNEAASAMSRNATTSVAAEASAKAAAAATPPAVATTRSSIRTRFGLPVDQPVGLFLGSVQAYRGFDALVAGLDRLGDRTAVPGTIAVAGPERASLPSHDRLRALGRVEDVGALLQAVGFVVNVNRFSLFDLSIIEALESGRPLLIHESGGNRAFRALGAGGVALPDLEPASVAAGLEQCFTLAQAELDSLGRQSRACYEAHLTPALFARRHLDLYDRAARGERACQTA